MIRSELTNNASCLVHQNITQAIIGSFYEVYDELGHGFLESVYRESMTFALNSLGFGVEQEKTVKACFRGHIVGIFRTDLVVEGAVVVELKCARTIDNMH